jgi:hypothetical protein
MATKSTKSTKSTKPARMTDADRMSAMTFGAFADTMREAVTKGADAVRGMAVTFYAATVHGEASKWTGATGKGAFAWAVAECGLLASKGRFSQYVTYGAWIDAEERVTGVDVPHLIRCETDARAVQALWKASNVETREAFIRTLKRSDVEAATAKPAKPAATGSDDGADDAEEGSTKSGRKSAVTAAALADAIGDMVTAALARRDTTPETAARLLDALRGAVGLAEGYCATAAK